MPEGILCNKKPVATREDLDALLADSNGKKLAILSDNEMLLDVAYIAFAIILPLIFTLRRGIRRVSNLYVLLAAEIFGCVYFIKRLIG